ncbi:unnamed protein product [Discosporangium mesarthrocarpum]
MIVVGTREDSLSFELPTNNLGSLSLHGILLSSTNSEGFDVCSSSPTPAAANAKFLPRQDGEGAGNGTFRELICALLWVANMTRPDISNRVRSLARYSQDPSEEHWKGAVRVLQYLHGSREQGIVYEQGRGLELPLQILPLPETEQIDVLFTEGL